MDHPLQALGAGGMVANAIKGDKQSGAEKASSEIAGQQAALGKDLTSGKLQPGQQGIIDKQLQDAITTIKSKYAGMGLSGSTMEASEIANAQQQAGNYATQLIQQNTTTGLNALNMASSSNQQIVQDQIGQDKSLYDSIIALAGTGSGGGKSAHA